MKSHPRSWVGLLVFPDFPVPGPRDVCHLGGCGRTWRRRVGRSVSRGERSVVRSPVWPGARVRRAFQASGAHAEQHSGICRPPGSPRRQHRRAEVRPPVADRLPTARRRRSQDAFCPGGATVPTWYALSRARVETRRTARRGFAEEALA
jgi:hypothetical protein